MGTPVMTKIVGFGHRQRVGKDLACDILYKKLLARKQRPMVKSFASVLKELAYRLFMWGGMQNEAYYEAIPDAKETRLIAVGKTPRQIMIEFGNKIREIHPDVWVHNTLNSVPSSCTHLLISDVRYPNEAQHIKARGGYVVKVNRPDVIRSDDVADTALQDYDGWDYEIDNNSTKVKYTASLMEMVKELEL